MKVAHRVSFRASHPQCEELVALGVVLAGTTRLPGDDLIFVTFEVEEAHVNWPEVHARLEGWNVRSDVRTEFSPEEVGNSRWLNLVPEWHYGYPQPREREFGYRHATYDVTHYCPRCGTGLIQRAPFQMKGEPKWGRRQVLQLNWVFDEFFVTPDAWASIFQPFGIECRAVLNTKGVELKTVVQLVATEEVGVDADSLSTDRTVCSMCSSVKYNPVKRGHFPRPTTEPGTAMFRTKEYFGSGGLAYKGLIVVGEFGRAIRDAKLLGVSLRPCVSL